jgi:hypothetical protein
MSRRPSFRGCIERHFGELRKSQRTTMHDLSLGLIQGGRLGWAQIARGMEDDTTVRHRIRRGWRFGGNARINLDSVTQGLVRWIGSSDQPLLVLLDWTALQEDYVLLAAHVCIDRRAVPIAWLVMWKSVFDSRRRSRNAAEEELIERVRQAMGSRRWILVADRAFARTALQRQLQHWGIDYVIRAPGNTWVRTGRFSGPLDALPRRAGQMKRYRQVRYRQKCSVEANLVVAHKEPAPHPWYLLTTLDCSAGRIAGIYRRRMDIEQSFRDAKTNLGLSKTWLSRPERMERLLVLLAIAMVVLTLTGLAHQHSPRPRDPQLTTNRRGRCLSIFRLGLELFRQSGLPPALYRLRLFSIKRS